MWSLLPPFKVRWPLIAAGPLVGALLAAPIGGQVEAAGRSWRKAGHINQPPGMEGKCAGRGQANVESPIPGHTSCRMKLPKGERSTEAVTVHN